MIFMNFFARTRGDGAEDTRPVRLALVVDQHRRLLSKRMYERPAPDFLAVPTMTAFMTSPFFTLALGIAPHRHDDDVADRGHTSPRAPEHLDAQDLARAELSRRPI